MQPVVAEDTLELIIEDETDELTEELTDDDGMLEDIELLIIEEDMLLTLCAAAGKAYIATATTSVVWSATENILD
jgi:hypothetical protein